MTKIQIVELDVADGLLPKSYREPVVAWLRLHHLNFVRKFTVDGDRLIGERYLVNRDGRRYIWHVDDHSEHEGNECARCQEGAQREAAWEAFDIHLQCGPPTFEMVNPLADREAPE